MLHVLTPYRRAIRVLLVLGLCTAFFGNLSSLLAIVRRQVEARKNQWDAGAGAAVVSCVSFLISTILLILVLVMFYDLNSSGFSLAPSGTERLVMKTVTGYSYDLAATFSALLIIASVAAIAALPMIGSKDKKPIGRYNILVTPRGESAGAPFMG